MAKKEKTQKLGEIIELMDEDFRKEIESTIDKGLKAMGCTKIKWKEFSVYESSVKLMKLILESKSYEYIMAIADKASENLDVKIAIKREKETSIWSINWNKIEMVVVLSISEKRLRQMKQKI